MIDIILVLLLVGYAISGFRQGLLVGLLSLGGFLGGAVLAMWLVPGLVGGVEPGTGRSIGVLLAVILVAWTGQFVGAMVGGRLREGVPHGPFAMADHVAGALAGLIAVSLVLWFVAGAIRGGPSPALSKTVASSKVIGTIDTLMPDGLVVVADSFRSAVGGSSFPRVFAGLGPERISPVDPPDPGEIGPDVVRRARSGIVKITGEAASCRRGQEGSGMVVAAGRVVTNAHVVAGVRRPRVQVAGTGRRYPARVVLFDARRDLAVLAVPGLGARPLPLGEDLERGDPAVVGGFPNDGPFKASAARVRSVITAAGEDIYGKPGAERQVYSLYVTVRPGNSGGPVVDAGGRVVGVVFAKSLEDKATGYALTMAEAGPVIAKGVTATRSVGTGACAVG